MVVLAIGVAVGFDSGSDIGHGSPMLAYVTGRTGEVATVWLADANGLKPRRLGPGTMPLLSPDGATVAAAASGGRGPALSLYGAGSRGLFDQTVQTAQPLAWSHDSRYLAVALSGRDPTSSLHSALVVVETHTGRVRTIAHGQIHGASFAPDGSDRLAYGVAASATLQAVTDIYIAKADGSNVRALTRDGHSLNPVWGRTGIAYDVEQSRNGDLPAYELWLAAPSGGARRLTELAVPSLRSGLVPLQFDAGGARLLAEYVGVDTSQAWMVAVATGHAWELHADGRPVTGAGISSDGSTVLVDSGGFLEPPDFGRVESIPWSGGAGELLVAHGADPSWNR